MKKLAELTDGILALITADEYQQLQPPSPAPTINSIILDIPHRSQVGPGADARRNDCGATNVAMIITGLTTKSPTTDEIAIKYQRKPNQYMSFGDLIRALGDYRIHSAYKRPFTPNNIRSAIIAHQPVIALVKYPYLPHKTASFAGSHFITIYGLSDEKFLYHDSLAQNDIQLSITAAQLDQAMTKFDKNENQPYQALLIQKKAAPT